MGKITEDVKKVISKMKVFPVATASKEGVPNVVPIAFVKVQDDDTLLIANNFMNKTYKNLEENPQLSIYAYDMEEKKSYQIKGQVSIVKSGEVFDETVKWVQGAMPNSTPKSAIVVKVKHIYDCQPGPESGKEI